MISTICDHTNSYAQGHIMDGGFQSYMQSDGRWHLSWSLGKRYLTYLTVPAHSSSYNNPRERDPLWLQEKPNIKVRFIQDGVTTKVTESIWERQADRKR